jgi:hypothetical protein
VDEIGVGALLVQDVPPNPTAGQDELFFDVHVKELPITAAFADTLAFPPHQS